MLEKLKELLGEDVFNAHIAPKLGTDKKYFFGEGEFIPKSRFDEVNTQVKELKDQISARDKQLEELQKSVKGNEDLVRQIEELRTANKKAVEEYEAKLHKQAYEFAYQTELSKAGAKDVKVLDALIDKEKITFKDGKFLGLQEQIEALKKSHDYVFATNANPLPGKLGAGINGGLFKTPNPSPTQPITTVAEVRPWNRHKRFSN